MPVEKLAKPAKKPAKRKRLAIPKSLGACVDKYHDLRQERLAAEKAAREIQEDESALRDHIINNLSKKDEGGAVGKRFKGIVYTDRVPRIEDDKKFYDYVKKNNAFDLLNRAINAKAWRERTEDPKNRKGAIPGVGTFNVVKLSVTKIG